MLVVDQQLGVPLTELVFRFVRSSGPGGQNVNKVATKAVLRWDIDATTSLAESIKERFVQQNQNRINSEGELVLASDRFRSQTRNMKDCLDKLRALLSEVLRPPKPRRPTRPSAGVRRRRLEDKRHLSQKKRTRQTVDSDGN